ncbi:signal peptidase I [Frisingicoccus sp.]|uniref:signal peptidase I n=1 Tax=Frisingicoccus sp. TaxID=1918627 RepID=UPI003AB65C34
MEQEQNYSPPTREQLERELERVKYRKGYLKALRGTVAILVVVAAVAVLAATMMFPVLRIYGNSMTPTLEEGNIVAALKSTNYERGDLIAFYYNNKILVKRVIALPGEWVNIDDKGRVYINDILQEEEYLAEGEKDMGECDIELPYQVPEGRVFVMGDHRSVSIDSRSSTIGCVSEEQVVGRLLFKIWPFTGIGPVR